mgnify:CR=1 FL=1
MKKRAFIILLTLLSLPIPLRCEWKPIKSIPISPYSGDITIQNGKIWQVDIVKDSIFVYDYESKIKEKSIPTPGFYPYSVAAFKDTMIVSNEDEICFIDSVGNIYRKIYTSIPSITGLATDGKDIWVSGKSGKIYCLSKDDGTIIKNLEGPEGSINGFAYSDGYLWTTSRYHDEVYMIDPNRGEVVNILPSPGPYPSGIFAKDNTVYVSDFEKDSIFIFQLPVQDYTITSNPERSRITLCWEILNSGPGRLGDVDVFIAIPSDGENQKLSGEVEFTPKQDAFLTDQFDQKVAHYHLKDIKPEEHLILKGIIETEISSINYFILPEKVKSLSNIPGKVKERYLKDTDRFRIKDPLIQKSMKEAVGNEKNPYWIARKILNYVGNKIDYELVGGWDIVPEILRRGKGSCSEYAYATIALLRAARIPARFVGSVVQRGDRASIDGVFHRWIEVYLPGYGWVQADPGVADSPYPRRRALGFGHRSAHYLITTTGGGGSKYMGWSYNFNERIRNYDPLTNFTVRRYAIWEPLLKGNK